MRLYIYISQLYICQKPAVLVPYSRWIFTLLAFSQSTKMGAAGYLNILLVISLSLSNPPPSPHYIATHPLSLPSHNATVRRFLYTGIPKPILLRLDDPSVCVFHIFRVIVEKYKGALSWMERPLFCSVRSIETFIDKKKKKYYLQRNNQKRIFGVNLFVPLVLTQVIFHVRNNVFSISRKKI